MKKRLSRKLCAGLTDSGIDLDSDSEEFLGAHRYSLVKDIEIAFITKTPLRFILLGAGLLMVWMVYPEVGGKAILPTDWLRDLALAIVVVSVASYFYGRWQVYKLSRVII